MSLAKHAGLSLTWWQKTGILVIKLFGGIVETHSQSKFIFIEFFLHACRNSSVRELSTELLDLEV